MFSAIICLLIIIIGLLVCAALAMLVQQQNGTINERMTKYVGLKGKKDNSQVGLRWAPSSPVQSVIKALGKVWSDYFSKQAFEFKMGQAGIALRVSEFIAVTAGVCFICGVIAYLFVGKTWLVGLAAGVITCTGIFIWLKLKIDRRQQAFNEQLGDAALMIANALRSGMSFLQAMDMAGKEMQPPIAGEFSQVVREVRLGLPLADALNQLSMRIPSYNLSLFVTAVLVEREIGGNLAFVMDHIADSVRERIIAGREMHTLTAQGRLSGLVVGAIPIAVVAAITAFRPGYYDALLASKWGYWCVGVCAVNYLLGIIIIHRINKVDF